MLTSAEIRQQFLDFFASKGHQIVPSAPIVVKNDPTLLFTNAGMNQFKEYFLGEKQSPYPRIADTQKCLRVSGKHNDLEEVGVDHYHHTMFEMLGNWSFGDYFKAEAIAWSWELLTEVYKIPKDRLYVTVFEGDAKEGIPASTIALAEWKKLVVDEHIVYGNKKDNFWEMGDTGPCGPCSEIHVDLRSDEDRAAIPGRTLVNKDHPEVIEVWNNVFIQYNRKKDGSLEELPNKHVDTGMGFERLVRVLQNKKSNYDTDVFTGTIAAIEKAVGVVYGFSQSKADIAFRVIADHIRTIAFTIADGQLPSNTGAGYVVRRILRRAVRYYYSYLQYKQPLLHQLLPLLATQFENVFPEVQAQVDFIKKVVKEEEDAFLRTLDKGLKRIDDAMAEAKDGVLAGKTAFELFDTYGFPVDLTKLIAAENNLVVDEPGFETEMQQQKNRSRAATTVDAEDWVVLQPDGANSFVGYTQLQSHTHVVKYRKVTAKGKDSYQLVLGATPFYAESGGQVGDTGVLDFGTEQIEVLNTKKENNLFIHFTQQLPTSIHAPVVAKVHATRRLSTSMHHTATHLLHAALRQVLGSHVAQKGSLVNDEQLRFDFSHFAKVSAEEIQQVEDIVNEKIQANIPVVIKEMSKEDALALGAMALFGEKYGDVVRVVIADENYSVELCGGTHVGFTGQLGFCKITHETAVAAGVRRLEAMVGKAAQAFVNQQLAELSQVKQLVKNNQPVKAIEQLQDELTQAKRKLEGFEQKEINSTVQQLSAAIETLHQQPIIAAVISANSADAVKKVAAGLQAAHHQASVVLAAAIDGKATVVAAFTDAFIQATSTDAVQFIKQKVTPLIQGGGGGNKNLATAGGQKTNDLAAVIQAFKTL
ncbi:MAG: alanine--tRNA ligase [Bacteroidetes bacterium]|nr:MAG: alanine--tRNA ligase [Bacteroidota bacterium]